MPQTFVDVSDTVTVELSSRYLLAPVFTPLFTVVRMLVFCTSVAVSLLSMFYYVDIFIQSTVLTRHEWCSV